MLFPHSCLPETGIKQILSFLGPLTLCEPWFLERPVFLSEMEAHRAVQVLHPPESRNPGEGFRALLQEYREWSKSHRDRSYREFIQAVRGQESGEESSWAIRQSLLRGAQAFPAREQDQTVKSHLILHLARDIDESRYEADNLLETLRQAGSPLAGSVEEDPGNPIADLPHFQGEPLMGAFAMEQVFEAWFALFGEYVKNQEPLVTINREVLACMRDKWEEKGGDSRNAGLPCIAFPWPDFSQMGLEDLLSAREGLSGDSAAAPIMHAMRHPDKDPSEHLDRLARLSKAMDGVLEGKTSWGRLLITVTRLPPFSGGEQKDAVFRHFSGKTLILVEGE